MLCSHRGSYRTTVCLSFPGCETKSRNYLLEHGRRRGAGGREAVLEDSIGAANWGQEGTEIPPGFQGWEPHASLRVPLRAREPNYS